MAFNEIKKPNIIEVRHEKKRRNTHNKKNAWNELSPSNGEEFSVSESSLKLILWRMK